MNVQQTSKFDIAAPLQMNTEIRPTDQMRVRLLTQYICDALVDNLPNDSKQSAQAECFGYLAIGSTNLAETFRIAATFGLRNKRGRRLADAHGFDWAIRASNTRNLPANTFHCDVLLERAGSLYQKDERTTVHRPTAQIEFADEKRLNKNMDAQKDRRNAISNIMPAQNLDGRITDKDHPDITNGSALNAGPICAKDLNGFTHQKPKNAAHDAALHVHLAWQSFMPGKTRRPQKAAFQS